jgi:hypothetical protein
MYRLVPHALLATWRSLAQTNIRAELPSGNVPTTRVRRRISRFSRVCKINCAFSLSGYTIKRKGRMKHGEEEACIQGRTKEIH